MGDCQIVAVVSNRRGLGVFFFFFLLFLFLIFSFAVQLETNNVESEPIVQLQG